MECPTENTTARSFSAIVEGDIARAVRSGYYARQWKGRGKHKRDYQYFLSFT
jgi:hypothetical protein